MAKINIEICMISARGLSRSKSLFLKPQWFAVGWINPRKKYCSKVDNSGSSTATWKTKFSASFDETSYSLQGLALTIEVYRRQRIFLREKLWGVAVVPLKEFLVRFFNRTDPSGIGITDTQRFQLRKRNSEKPCGFVDIAIRISEKDGDLNPHTGIDERSMYSVSTEGMTLDIEDGPVLPFPAQPHQSSPYANYQSRHPDASEPPAAYPVKHPYTSPAGISGYHRPRTPPPPPPPSNTGFLLALFPGREDVPPSGRNSEPSFAMDLGASALAAGAVIFGDDFMSS